MQTGMICPSCETPILTNQLIVGLPVIRITDIKKSALTGSELVFHVTCFTQKLRGAKKPIILNMEPA